MPRRESATTTETPTPPPAAGTEEVRQDAALDSMLGWMSLYLPTWGSSTLLHVAAVILLVFTVTQMRAEPIEGTTPVRMTPENLKKVPIEKRPDDRTSLWSHGKLKLQESSFVWKKTPLTTPGIGTLKNAPLISVIGVGDGPVSGGKEGLDNWDTNRIFRRPPQDDTHPGAVKVVYVVDRSGSMTDSIDFVKYELKRSLSELSDDCEFHVIFYSSGPPVEMATRRLVNATERNKEAAYEFIDSVVAQGETDPSQALERAFACKPDMIYLLTDGEFDRQVVDLVGRLNTGRRTTVQTIGFLYRTAEDVLRQIARDTGGSYKFVAEKDLEAIAQGR
jgi:hypothetical protein